jgi:hypothetical protein
MVYVLIALLIAAWRWWSVGGVIWFSKGGSLTVYQGRGTVVVFSDPNFLDDFGFGWDYFPMPVLSGGYRTMDGYQSSLFYRALSAEYSGMSVISWRGHGTWGIRVPWWLSVAGFSLLGLRNASGRRRHPPDGAFPVQPLESVGGLAGAAGGVTGEAADSRSG